MIITGCVEMKWNYYYPYCNVNPIEFQMNLPTDFESCLNQFDSILSKNVINHFKNQNSSIASNSQEIGGLFIFEFMVL